MTCSTSYGLFPLTPIVSSVILDTKMLQTAYSAAPAKYRCPAKIHRLTSREVFAASLSEQALQRAPSDLFLSGNIALAHATLRVSIVGSRAASPEGKRRAAKLAAVLASRGVVVVSGLAAGIDHSAHTAAIRAGGRTIAIIGTPLNRCYPARHARLQEEIARDHLLVSQFKPESRVYPSNFVARNRTMAMLSHASVIVEAGDTSGSLSQAAEIQRLGRPLFIMRNVVENTALKWPRSFLNSGAQILDDVEQVLSALSHGTCPQPQGVQQLPLHGQA